MKRRRLLRTLGTTATVGLAGCSTQDRTETPTGTPYDTSTPTGTPTATRTPGDTTDPVIDEFTAQYTDTAGEVAVSLEGHDDEQVEIARITTATDDLSRHPGDPAVTVETRMHGDPGRINDVTATLTDAARNTAADTVDTYVRKYDAIDQKDTRFGIGGCYLPQMGDAFENGCVREKTPTAGAYEDPIRPDTVSRHIDQMTGHGINRVIYTWTGFGDAETRLKAFLDSQLIDHISIEPEIDWNVFMQASDQSWKDTVLPETADILTDNLLNRENTYTHDQRPVVEVWGGQGYLAESSREKIKAEWGGYPAMVSDFRASLTVDGTEPFLTVNMGPTGVLGHYDYDAVETFASQFDAISNWFPLVNQYAGETYSWKDALPDLRKNWDRTKEFTDNHDMDFVPKVFPGFDDRGNECWGPTDEDGNPLKRHIPRTRDRFRQLLELAGEYATTEMIDIATWNDWAEGTQVEPGTHRGTDYDTAYVETVAEFQRGDLG